MPCKNLYRLQRYVIGKDRIAAGEYFVEYPSHGENRRADIQRPSLNFDGTHFAARSCRALNNDNFAAPAGKLESRDQTAYPGSDDGDTLPTQGHGDSNNRVDLIGMECQHNVTQFYGNIILHMGGHSMEADQRIEAALKATLQEACIPPCPPQLSMAIGHAVFPGGARVRPRLCLAVAAACGDDQPDLADTAAAAIELLHCASLVHDDLPCFDNAELRRGQASVHKAYGEPLAVLTGDALIVAAFQTLARGISIAPQRAAKLLSIISLSVGGPAGIVAGQAWECEEKILLSEYHRAKTASLFSGATTSGAAAAGHEPEPWSMLGELLGEAYQVADDICDVVADPLERGKPSKRDGALGRPNAAQELGVSGAVRRLRAMLADAMDSVPTCPGSEALRAHIARSALPYLPKVLLVAA
jgi:geranylgeranyl diphosphate synthase, type II